MRNSHDISSERASGRSSPAVGSESFRRGVLLASVVFFCLLAGCSGGVPPAASKPSAAAKPTATALPAGTVLYQADWSHGLSDWQGTQGWQVVQGKLQVEASSRSSITVPYKPTVANYAIEARVQILDILADTGASFNIFAQQVAGKGGYSAGVEDLRKGPSPYFSHPQAQVISEPTGSQTNFHPIDYEPGKDWHDYRVEVRGSQVSFFIDDHQISWTSSELGLSDGPLGLEGTGIHLQVSSFRITTL